MKHTPGPWEITPLLMARYSRIKDTRVNPAYRRRIIGPDDSEIKGGAKILMELDGYHLTDEEYNANAALIAAAPDLLEASTNLVGAIRILENLSAEGKDTDDAWSEVVSELLETQAVIAKATSKATTQNP
ncbi:hypothetical protein LCGC14_2796990 [marine sediment metagenome]|uniref:Uncharacterized protein n=1 Tax=marine sediment metagenome TaxID=412755 RepID=A0A0F9BF98_9ZZZZ